MVSCERLWKAERGCASETRTGGSHTLGTRHTLYKQLSSRADPVLLPESSVGPGLHQHQALPSTGLWSWTDNLGSKMNSPIEAEQGTVRALFSFPIPQSRGQHCSVWCHFNIWTLFPYGAFHLCQFLLGNSITLSHLLQLREGCRCLSCAHNVSCCQCYSTGPPAMEIPQQTLTRGDSKPLTEVCNPPPCLVVLHLSIHVKGERES